MARKRNGYWNEDVIISELKSVIRDHGTFPTQAYLHNIGKSDLSKAISGHGGFKYFRSKMGHKPLIKNNGYWTENTIISELKTIIDDFGDFPTQIDLQKMGKSNLACAMSKCEGVEYFRDKLGFKSIKKPNGYWTDKTIISELGKVIGEIGQFPLRNTLDEIDETVLSTAIGSHGGFNYFRKKMGYDITQKTKRYWNDETIMSELKNVIDDLGHFPSRVELKKSNNGGLVSAINKNSNSLNYFRNKTGYDTTIKTNGYWNDGTIMFELKKIIDFLGYLPSGDELRLKGNGGLTVAIARHGGFNHFKQKCGLTISMQEKYISKLTSYVNKRGRKTEKFVKDIITDWLDIHDLPTLDCNVKLSKGNVIEFVCDHNKKIGIDVTNTKASKSGVYEQINKKWRHKEYCIHLDELWIVVFTNVLTSSDYDKLNIRCPDNVKIFSIDGFLKELDYSVENYDKIDRLKECCFHTKDEIINTNKTFVDE